MEWRTVDGSLTTQLFKHFGSAGEPVARLADGDVEDQLVNAKFSHWIRALVLARIRLEMLLAL